MKLKITRERFNQIVQEEHQRIQEEKKKVMRHKGFPLEPGETPEDFEKAARADAAARKKRDRERGRTR